VRLGTLFLISSALVAQVPLVQKALPWAHLQEPPWQLGAVSPDAPLPPLDLATSQDLPLQVELYRDGFLRILDPRGLITLQIGLPGRPTRLWRDAGHALDPIQGKFKFPLRSGLDGGLGSMPLAQGEDFRPLLEGLLWVLDDGERTLTILNPARAQVVYVPLPAGGNLDLRFHRDHLEVWTGGDSSLGRRERVGWTLPWVALLPQFLTLSSPRATGALGTALKPFPSE